MSGVLSKRQQARNEKALQGLVQSIPGNNTCADCQARNPAWASWNLGIFLCMRCAAIHRKLGTHVSKVKSLSMDSWSNEQVDNMRKVGNIASNKAYNPGGQRPPVPIDADEADAAMERFIRQKYINSAFSKSNGANRHRNTGSSGSDDIPPPLPPKTPGRFGVRSASSIFPLSSKAKRDASPGAGATVHGSASGSFESGGQAPTSAPPRALSFPRPESSGSGPGLRSKISQAFGSSKQPDAGDTVDAKLAALRDMGFLDDRRNTVVLKSVSWDLERAIEMLVRMGDAGVSNGRLSPHPLASPRDSSLSAPTRTLTPSSTSMKTVGLGVPTPSSQRTPSSLPGNNSLNPFDALDFASPPAPPQSSQSTGTLQTKNPYNTINPFDAAPAAQQQTAPFDPTVTASTSAFNLNQAFQNMALSPPQPLFPHHTGGNAFQQQQQQPLQAQPQEQYTLLQQQQQQQQQQVFQSHSPAATLPASQTYFTTSQQTFFPQPAQHSNPFANANGHHQQQQTIQPMQSSQPLQPLFVNTTASSHGFIGNNPFTRSPTRIQSPSALVQIPEQSQASYFTAFPQSQTYPLSNGNQFNTTLPSSGSQQPSNQLQLLQPQPPQQLHIQQQQQIKNPFMAQPQPPSPSPRLHNTASIMALYNMQPAAPAPTTSMHQSSTQLPVQQQLQQPAGGLLSNAAVVQTNTATSPAATNPFFSTSANTNGTSLLSAPETQYPASTSFALPGQRQPPPPPPAPSSGAALTSNSGNILVGGRSRDSMMALGLEWSNGRHSPDAFASLSARH